MSGIVASALFETKGGQGSLAVPGKGKRQVVECFSCELLFPKKAGGGNAGCDFNVGQG